MMSDRPREARERVLNVAEHLFRERGYASVTLKEIAEELGMKQASLYYHVPGGKEALFIEVSERGFHQHRAGLEEAIAGAGSELRKQLLEAARWILSHPMPDLGRMAHSDMPEISEAHAQRLMQIAFDSLLMPIVAIFQQGYDRGEFASKAGNLIEPFSAEKISRETILMAGAFIAVITSISNLPVHFTPQPKAEMAENMVDVFLYGLLTR